MRIDGELLAIVDVSMMTQYIQLVQINGVPCPLGPHKRCFTIWWPVERCYIFSWTVLNMYLVPRRLFTDFLVIPTHLSFVNVNISQRNNLHSSKASYRPERTYLPWTGISGSNRLRKKFFKDRYDAQCCSIIRASG